MTVFSSRQVQADYREIVAWIARAPGAREDVRRQQLEERAGSDDHGYMRFPVPVPDRVYCRTGISPVHVPDPDYLRVEA